MEAPFLRKNIFVILAIENQELTQYSFKWENSSKMTSDEVNP